MPAGASVLLDVDGTLVDSNYAHVDAWSHAFAKAGHPYQRGRFTARSGWDRTSSWQSSSAKSVAEMIWETVSDAHDSLFAEMIDDVQTLPGARDLLAALTQRGYERSLQARPGGARSSTTLTCSTPAK